MIDISLIDKKILLPEQVDLRYKDSVFVHLKTLTPKQKGKRYELITEFALKTKGYKVEKPKSTDHDRIINGYKCEIKGSMLNKNSDIFSFLQIRPKQDYDKIIFSMFYPFEMIVMEMSKENIIINIENKTFKKQHGGNKAVSNTYMYYGNRETLLNIGAKELDENHSF
jgi:hypothetical protein